MGKLAYSKHGCWAGIGRAANARHIHGFHSNGVALRYRPNMYYHSNWVSITLRPGAIWRHRIKKKPETGATIAIAKLTWFAPCITVRLENGEEASRTGRRSCASLDPYIRVHPENTQAFQELYFNAKIRSHKTCDLAGLQPSGALTEIVVNISPLRVTPRCLGYHSSLFSGLPNFLNPILDDPTIASKIRRMKCNSSSSNRWCIEGRARFGRTLTVWFPVASARGHPRSTQQAANRRYPQGPFSCKSQLFKLSGSLITSLDFGQDNKKLF
jgi:hypothetical protein